MGIDPVTHKPFSQIFSDYGSISSNPIIASFSTLTLNNPNLEPPASSSVLTGPYSTSNYHLPQFEIAQPHLFSEAVSSSCSSSSSTTLNLPKLESQTPAVASNWNEFLVSDPVFEHFKQDEEVVGSYDYESVATSDGNQTNDLIDQTTSFVDVILDKDKEMRSQFPPLSDPSFD